MTPVTCFAHKSVALFGLGGSGFATARALMAGGAKLVVWDDNEAARVKAGAEGLLVQDLHTIDWRTFDALVLSPGVPFTHPVPHWSVMLAREANVEVIGDIELFCRERQVVAPNAPFIAITGTNGKSTTTALISHILQRAGFDVQMGGNIGIPILALKAPNERCVHVIECSSFQIDLAPSIAPSIGLLLNLTPDHLDRHGSMEHYASIKERLIAGSDLAVIGIDDDYCRAIAVKRESAHAPLRSLSIRGEPHAAYADDHGQIFSADGAKLPLNLSGISTLRGAHNAQNALAAIEALRDGPFGLTMLQLQDGLSSYPGLPHRMEEVGRLGHVLFINDSKATNADATEKALLSFENIYWILGGKSKEGGIEPLRPLFSRIRKAYLIGSAAADFARTIGDAFPIVMCETLDRATQLAAKDAQTAQDGERVVLLSPACASYDQFANFEVRGNAFREMVCTQVLKASEG